MNIGATIKKCRENRGMSQKALAETSDMTQGSLSLIEKNKRVPSLQALQRIADVFGIPVWVLLYMAEDECAPPLTK